MPASTFFIVFNWIALTYVHAQLLSCVWLFVIPWTVACQALLSIKNSGTCSNILPWSRWWHPTTSSSVIPFSVCLQSFPASGYSPVSQFFTLGGQSIRASASASVLSINIQDWFPLELTGLIFLLAIQGALKSLGEHKSKASIVQQSAFFMVQLTSVHDYWKKHSFDYRDLCQQIDVTTF